MGATRHDGLGHQPAEHYDRVHAAWRLIMGEEFHYGYFVPAVSSLGEATAALTGQMLQRAAIRPGDRVLDVGCGTGRQGCDLAERHGAQVLGITTSAAGVRAANELAAQRGLERARFELRDGTHNGLADSSFDVVWALESSHLMRERRALLAESARVLAPGGRLVLCDIVNRRRLSFQEVRDRRDDFATLRDAFGDAHMLPLSDYTDWLEELGLRVTDVTDISTQTLPTFAAWRTNCARHEAEILDLIGELALEEFVRSCDILEGLWHEEVLGYGILGAAKP